MQIQIKEFTGPLDLLLQLIRREEMNIFDIDIHKITNQYLTFIETHPLPDLNSAGEFIKLAATLIYIKSRSLFPPDKTEQPIDEEAEDLKKNLVKNLLRTQNLQRLSQQLQQFPLIGRDVWTRKMIKPYFSPSSTKLNDEMMKNNETTDINHATQITQSPHTITPAEQIKLEPILKLLKSYHHIQQTSSWDNAQHTEPLPSLSNHIHNLSTNLSTGSSLKMSQLVSAKRNLPHTVLTFLSVLELCRLGFVSLFQQAAFSDIVITVLKTFRQKDFHLVQKIENPGL